MTDILTTPLVAPTTQFVELIFERSVVPPHYLRPVEQGAPYYDLSRVERLMPADASLLADMPDATLPREWEGLGPVYLLGGTLQTLRWSNSPVPAAYHVGRVPEATSYRFMGLEHEYTWNQLLDELMQRPADFRGYPVTSGAEHRLQFTPALPEEIHSESRDWEATTKRLRTGAEALHEGSHYQLYEEVTDSTLR